MYLKQYLLQKTKVEVAFEAEGLSTCVIWWLGLIIPVLIKNNTEIFGKTVQISRDLEQDWPSQVFPLQPEVQEQEHWSLFTVAQLKHRASQAEK